MMKLSELNIKEIERRGKWKHKDPEIMGIETNSLRVEKGDILIAMSGATTGKFGIYNSIRKAYQNQRVGNLKLNSKKIIDKKYIFNLLYSMYFISNIVCRWSILFNALFI